MKRIVSTIVGLAVAATMVHAAADEVTSVNGVGYVKKTVERGSVYLLTANFYDMSSGTVADVLDPNSLPVGTVVNFWDPAGQEYGATETLVGFPSFGWSPGTNMVDLGTAFWLSIPNGAPNPSYELTLAGEIPLDDTNSVALVEGFNFVAYPYPVELGLTDPKMGLSPQVGDTISYWVPGTGWQTETYVAFPTEGWTPGTFMTVLGEGFIYNSKATGQTVVWDATRPFSW